ncbi:MAG: DUF1538 domain-containing protein [Firmicutes bacterium]|nr:DUF1538 domain-containing protein [Bacillota bacterium]
MSIFAGIGQTSLEVLQALLPLVIILLLTPRFVELPEGFMQKTIKGLLLTFVGLTLLLHGINVGFNPASQLIGEILGGRDNRWIAIPIGALVGFVVAIAEPGLRVQGAQVEEASSGAIKQNVLVYTVSIAVGLAVGIGMARIVFGIPFTYIAFPGYILLIILLRFTEPTFSAIAFDSGAVVTGPMVVTIILSLAVGVATTTPGRNPIVDGFGMTAFVALAPIMAVMLLGQIYKNKD